MFYFAKVTSMKRQELQDLIERFGGQVKFAKTVNVSQGTVTGWLNNKHGISPDNAQKIEIVTGGEFKAVDLCPRMAKIEQFKAQYESQTTSE